MGEILDLIESVPEGLPTYYFIMTCSILNASLRSVETLAREKTQIRKEYASLLRGRVDEVGLSILSCAVGAGLCENCSRPSKNGGQAMTVQPCTLSSIFKARTNFA